MESFAELSFIVSQKLINKKKTQAILLKIPDKNVGCYDEIQIWHKL